MYFFAILTDFQKSVSTKSVDINLIKEISNSSKGEVVQFNTTPFYYESPTELISLAIDYYSQTEDGRWNWTDPKQGEKWGELVYSGYMRNELKTIIDTLRNEYDRVSEIQKTDPSNENLRRLDLLEGPILEASFYNALSSIKLGNCKGAWFDLNSVESYGDSPDSLAHNYMEIDLRDLLLDRNILEKLCELDRSIFDGNLKAVLIGIDDYSSTRVTSESNTKTLYPIGDLKYATSDAIAVNDLLLSQKMGWDTQLLINEDATLKKRAKL